MLATDNHTGERGEREEIRVLHVDDDEAFLEMAASRLAAVDDRLSVTTTTDPTTVADRIGYDDVDCLVTDYEMPALDGLELLAELREDRPELPIILFTGRGTEEVATTAFERGATEYVRKSGSRETYAVLAERIRRSVRRYRERLALDRTARRFEALLDGISGYAYRCRGGTGWQIEHVTEGCREVLGREPAEFVDGDVEYGPDVVHPEDHPEVQATLERAVERGGSFEIEYRIQTPDGTVRWVHERGRVTDTGAGDPLIEGFVTDETERIERRRQLARKSSLLDSIFEQIPVHLFVKDERARHVLVSEEMFADPDLLMGKTDIEVTRAHEDDPDVAGIEKARETTADDRYVIETGERIIDKEEYDERTDSWTLTSKVPWTDDDGDVVGVIGVSRDITERKEREQRLRRQNRRLDRFAGVVSHDLRTPLGTAAGYLDLASETCDCGASETLADAESALERLDDLVADLLELARAGDAVDDPEPVAFPDVVEAAWDDIDAERATLRTEGIPAELQAHEERLRQLVENLLANAVQHGSTGGSHRRRGATGEGGSTAGGAKSPTAGDSSTTVTVTGLDDAGGFAVADDGPGIPAGEREDVFEPGYTTASDGTGLGLDIVADVVEAHGWSVEVVESEWGGARFEVRTDAGNSTSGGDDGTRTE